MVEIHAALLPGQLEVDVPGGVPGLQELPVGNSPLQLRQKIENVLW